MLDLGVADVLVGMASLATLIVFLILVRRAMRMHNLSTYANLLIVLAVFALIGRLLFFASEIEGENKSVRALLLFYPSLNMLLISFAITYDWLYQLIAQIQGPFNMRLLERQMRVFVWAKVVFIVIMYLLFMLSIPRDNEGTFSNMYFFLGIIEIVMVVIIGCSMAVYVSRQRLINQQYGKVLQIEGTVFLIANIISAAVYLYLAFTDPYDEHVGDFKRDHILIYTIALMLFFSTTEFIPLFTLAVAIRKFQQLIHDPQLEQEQEDADSQQQNDDQENNEQQLQDLIQNENDEEQQNQNHGGSLNPHLTNRQSDEPSLNINNSEDLRDQLIANDALRS